MNGVSISWETLPNAIYALIETPFDFRWMAMRGHDRPVVVDCGPSSTPEVYQILELLDSWPLNLMVPGQPACQTSVS